LDTAYGRVLTGKLLVLAPLLAIGAVNLRRVVPALASAADFPARAAEWAGRLRTLVTAETIVAVPLLALAATLTGLPPATSAAAAGPVELTAAHGDLTLTLSVRPNKVGVNRAAITIARAGAPSAAGELERVTVYVRSLDMDMGLGTFEASRGPDGSYYAEISIPMAGRSLISVEVAPVPGDPFVVEHEIYSAW
jgi:copper transport protein